MKTVSLELTTTQAGHFEWLLGLPLFSDSDAASLEYERDITADEAQAIVAWSETVKLNGLTATMGNNPDLIEQELIQELERLANMADSEGIDDQLIKGKSHQQARLWANAQIKSIESLIAKLESATK